jgi:hypothetical protein
MCITLGDCVKPDRYFLRYPLGKGEVESSILSGSTVKWALLPLSPITIRQEPTVTKRFGGWKNGGLNSKRQQGNNRCLRCTQIFREGLRLEPSARLQDILRPFPAV